MNYFNKKMINIINNAQLSKNDMLRLMVDNIVKNSDLIVDGDKFYNEILEREKIGTTAIGGGVAIPHTRTNVVKDVVVSLALLKESVDFNSLDGERVRIVIMVGVPIDRSKKYLKILSSLSKIFRDDCLRETILESLTTDSLIEAIAGID